MTGIMAKPRVRSGKESLRQITLAHKIVTKRQETSTIKYLTSVTNGPGNLKHHGLNYNTFRQSAYGLLFITLDIFYFLLQG